MKVINASLTDQDNPTLLIVTIGSKDRPAREKDLAEAEQAFEELVKGTSVRVLVTHHETRLLAAIQPPKVSP